MQKIVVRALEEYTKLWPRACPYRITVTTRSGQNHVRRVSNAKGDPDNPLSDQEIEDKFRRLAEPVMGQERVSAVLGRLWRMEEIGGVGDLMALFALESSNALR
jgi:2-methylcitrate dehydratase